MDALYNFDGADYSQIPSVLSGTRLYAGMSAPRQVTDGIFPYEVNSRLWSDRADKERYVTMPPGSKIVPTDTDHYQFPDKTVMIKNFMIDTGYGDDKTRIYIETRFLVFRKDSTGGQWHGITYQWRLDQTDADLVDGNSGANTTYNVKQNGQLRGKRWHYPAKWECTECHKGRGYLGFITPQLNRPLTSNPSLNQLQDLFNKGVLSANPVAGKINSFRWADLNEAGAPVELRARSYFAANCSHCHGNGQLMEVSHDFDYLNSAVKFLYSQDPGGYVGKPGRIYPYPYLIYPGKPDSSEILVRMMARTTDFQFTSAVQMPPIATYQIDTTALMTIKNWVCQMGKVDTLSAACKLPEGLAVDSTYWMDPVALWHGGNPHGRMVWKARIHGQNLEVPASAIGSQPVSLFDSRGRSLSLEKESGETYRILSPMRSGVYFLRAGGALTPLQYIP